MKTTDLKLNMNITRSLELDKISDTDLVLDGADTKLGLRHSELKGILPHI